jgi:transcriptional regulator GlxA family with amidase domain
MCVSLTPQDVPTSMKDVDRRVVIVIFDGFQLFDLAGPADVFATASLLSRESGYGLEVTAVRAGSVRAHNGIATVAQYPLAEVVDSIGG